MCCFRIELIDFIFIALGDGEGCGGAGGAHSVFSRRVCIVISKDHHHRGKFIKKAGFDQPGDLLSHFFTHLLPRSRRVLLGHDIVLVRLIPAGRGHVLHVLKGCPHACYRTSYFQILSTPKENYRAILGFDIKLF